MLKETTESLMNKACKEFVEEAKKLVNDQSEFASSLKRICDSITSNVVEQLQPLLEASVIQQYNVYDKGLHEADMVAFPDHEDGGIGIALIDSESNLVFSERLWDLCIDKFEYIQADKESTIEERKKDLNLFISEFEKILKEAKGTLANLT